MRFFEGLLIALALSALFRLIQFFTNPIDFRGGYDERSEVRYMFGYDHPVKYPDRWVYEDPVECTPLCRFRPVLMRLISNIRRHMPSIRFSERQWNQLEGILGDAPGAPQLRRTRYGRARVGMREDAGLRHKKRLHLAYVRKSFLDALQPLSPGNQSTHIFIDRAVIRTLAVIFMH